MMLPAWYTTLAPREQKIVLYGAIAAVALLLVGGTWHLHNSAAATLARLETKRADLAWMQSVAPRLQAMPVVRSDESLPLMVDRTARDAGLAQSLSGADPAGQGGLRVRFEGASFDALVIWLSRVQQERGLVVESASIDSTGPEGLVNANLVLRGS